MDKSFATFQLGDNSEAASAAWLGVSLHHYKTWPDRLHPIMVERVYAAHLRKAYGEARGLTPREFFADPEHGSYLEHQLLTRVSFAAVMTSLLNVVPPELAAPRIEPSGPVKRAYERRKRTPETSTSNE